MVNFVVKECERCLFREEEEGEDEFVLLKKEEELVFIVLYYVGVIWLGIVDICKSVDVFVWYG